MSSAPIPTSVLFVVATRFGAGGLIERKRARAVFVETTLQKSAACGSRRVVEAPTQDASATQRFSHQNPMDGRLNASDGRQDGDFATIRDAASAQTSGRFRARQSARPPALLAAVDIYDKPDFSADRRQSR
jgi:hypothetical protein